MTKVWLGLKGYDPFFVDENSLRKVLITGFPGTGKSSLMLHLILQSISRGNFVLVLDPMGDLARKALTYLVPSPKIIYLDPHFFLKKGYAIKIDPFEEGLPTQLIFLSFVKSLASAFPNMWSRTIEKKVFSLLSALNEKGQLSLSVLHKLYLDKEFAKTLLKRKLSQTEKLYKMLNGLITAPSSRFLFAEKETALNFSKVFSHRAVVFANLRMGQINPHVSRFWACLLLSRTFFLSTQDRKVNVDIYIEDGYRLPLTLPIQSILQTSLSNLHFFFVTQFIDQLPKLLASLLLTKTSSKITFAVGNRTARRISHFFRMPSRELLSLPLYSFIFSSGRNVERLKTKPYPPGPNDFEKIASFSLKVNGHPI